MSTDNLPATRTAPDADLTRDTPHLSLTRSASNSRQRRVQELGKGNPTAWRHGTFATVGNHVDVQTEHALILASAHGALDPIQDYRLIEDLALARVQRNRAIIALETEPSSSVLTSYASRLMALVERGERAVRQRQQERVIDMRPTRAEAERAVAKYASKPRKVTR